MSEGIKILIVEDEAIVAESLKKIIRELECEVVGHAVTAEDAVSKAIELKPDLILMDINLKSDKTGVDAAREIREKHHCSIIYITAYADINLVKDAQETGAYAYIVKPFVKKQLKTCMKIVLYKSNRERELEELKKKLEETATSEIREKLESEIEEKGKNIEKRKEELMLFLKSQ